MGDEQGKQPIPQLWYPNASIVLPPLPTHGDYAGGFPRGAVVHYTAGAYGLSELDLARKLGYAYFLIEENGGVHQGFPLNRWGSHAGESSWPGLDGHVSQYLVGIEVDCAGILTADGHGNFRSWWGSTITADAARLVEAKANRHAGVYHRYTDAQEAALTALLLWMKGQAPDVFDLELVLGHDEVAPTRKEDPGGSLSVTMPEYRALLQAQWKNRLHPAADVPGTPAA